MSRDGRLDLDDPQLNAGLGEAVDRFGADLWTRPGLIRATLSDALGEAAFAFRGEIDLLEQSVEVGLVGAVSAGAPTDAVLGELRDAGIDPTVAEQLARVWVRAIRTTPTTATPTTATPTTASPTTATPTTATPIAAAIDATILPDATTPASTPPSAPAKTSRSAPPFIASIPSEPSAAPGSPSGSPPTGPMAPGTSPAVDQELGAPIGPAPTPLDWAPGASINPPATGRSDKRLLMAVGAAAAVIVVMAIAVGGFLILRTDDKVETTAGVSPGITAVQAGDTTTAPTSTAPTTTTPPATPTTIALEPATPTAVRGFFSAKVGGDCTDYPHEGFASVVCIVSTPDQPDHLTNFTAWGDLDTAVYAITHADAGETVMATAPWTAPDGRTGATMDTVDTTASYPYCRVWSYDGTPYTGEVCAADAAQLSALIPTYQS